MTKILFGRGFSAEDWRARATRLFITSETAGTIIEREMLRRRAVAAENIAESMDLTARLALD